MKRIKITPSITSSSLPPPQWNEYEWAYKCGMDFQHQKDLKVLEDLKINPKDEPAILQDYAAGYNFGLHTAFFALKEETKSPFEHSPYQAPNDYV